MQEINKKRLIKGGKVATIFIGALLTIVVCSGIWTLAETSLCIAAGVLFAGNTYAIIKATKEIKD